MLQAVWPPERIARSDRIRIRPQRRWNGKACALALDALSARRANAVLTLARQFGLLLGELLLELSPDVRRGALSTRLGLLPLGLGFSAVQRPQQLKDLGRRMTAVAFKARLAASALQGGAEWIMPWPLARARPRAVARSRRLRGRRGADWKRPAAGARGQRTPSGWSAWAKSAPRGPDPLGMVASWTGVLLRSVGGACWSPGNAQGAILGGGRLAVGRDWGIRLE